MLENKNRETTAQVDKEKVDYLNFQRKIFCPNVGDFNVL